MQHMQVLTARRQERCESSNEPEQPCLRCLLQKWQALDSYACKSFCLMVASGMSSQA